MRNDNSLWTGQSSVTRRVQKLEDKAREKQIKTKKLSPAADVVFEYIEKEKANIQKQVLTYIQTDTPKEDVKSTLLALKFYSTYLVTLQNNLKNLLRGQDERS